MKIKPLSRHPNAGFTLIEMLVIVVLITIIAAIAAPSWLQFLTRQRLNIAQSEAITAMREAQAKAKQQKRTWEVCFRDQLDTDGINRVQWSVRPVPEAAPANSCAIATINPWNNLTGEDADKITINTATSSFPGSPTGYYRVQFQEKGWVKAAQADNSQDIGKITFTPRNQPTGSKRCVMVSTLLGALRVGTNSECN